MIYVTSDLHGCPMSTLNALFEKANFTEEDFLFVLGDVVDRGEHGIDLLLWLTQQPNAQLILGNHEAMLLSCLFLFDDVAEETVEALDADQLRKFRHWQRNGGDPTMSALSRLRKQDADLFEGIIDYLNDAPLYEELSVGGRDFILVHGGLDHFSEDRAMEDYEPHDLIWARPTLNDVYYHDRHTVFGHTPAQFLTPDSPDRAVKTETWTCIDTGAACGRTPMLLRLDDLAEFYL